MQAGTDAELIAASRRGDRDAFAQIIERYQRSVYAVAFSGTRNRAMADDATQDTFVIAWRRIEELRETERLAAWLCGIARNLARDARRRHRREVVGEPDQIACASTPFHALSEAENESLVAMALGQMPDVYREPLVLYYYEDRSVDDVARSLGISTATTNKRLSRGRQRLADHVAAVERGLTRFGPRAGLAASVLAIIAVTVPASHVDASPVKGSTMNKLSLAAIATAIVGGATATAVIATRTGDAHAQAQTIAESSASTESCDVSKLLSGFQQRDGASLANAGKRPALASTRKASAIAIEANDCGAVGRYLAELEADTTHGADDRPDDETCAKCAGFYENQCESEAWTATRRACVLQAGDLINAHLCAGDVPTTAKQAEQIPSTLTCPVLATHLATVAQGAGLYADVTDFPQQIEAACTMGNWPVSLRQCFAAGTNVMALQACIHAVPSDR